MDREFLATSGTLARVFDDEHGLVGYVKVTEGRRGREYASGRARALDALCECATRAQGTNALVGQTLGCWETVASTVRRDASNAVKSSALRVLLTLAKSRARELGARTMKAHGRALRRDYERSTTNSKTVKGLLLRVIGAMHVGLKMEGLELCGADDAEDVADAPTAVWLRTASCRILDAALDDDLDDFKKNTLFMASALDALSSSLFVQDIEEDKSNHARIVRIVERVVSLKETGSRTDLQKSALDLITAHAHALKHELVKISAKLFRILLNLRTANNKDLSRCAAAAYDEFLRALSDAFTCEITSTRDMRGTLLETILKDIISVLDDDEKSERDKSACIRAMGKFAAPALTLLSGEYSEVNSYMGRLGKLTMFIKFKRGENEFQERFESIERQVALLSAYGDLLRIPHVLIDEALLGNLCTLVEWIWEQYAFENNRRKPMIRDAIIHMFIALASKDCALQTLLARVGSQLLALTLRFSSPDPIDRVLYQAAPIPMWPVYVDIWTELLGGDRDSVIYTSGYHKDDVKTTLAGVYGCFVNELLNFCTALDLGIKTLAGESKRANDDLDTVSVAVSLGDDATAANPGDMHTFLQLVEFAQKVLEQSSAEMLVLWVNHLSAELMLLANKNTSISGFYKLIGTLISTADRAGYFCEGNALDAQEITELFRQFLKDVLNDMRRFSGELLASILTLLLSLPTAILPISDLIEPLLRALELGQQYPPVVEIALDTLDGWLGGRHLEETSPYLPQIAESLYTYLDSATRADTLFSSEEIKDLDRQDVKGANRNKRKLENRDDADNNVLSQATLIRIVKLLGSMGGAAHGLKSTKGTKKSANELESPWSASSKLSVPVGLIASSTKLWLDNLLPRTSHLALFSQDRATKVAASEAIFGATVFLIGRSAQEPASKSGDFTRSESRYRSIFERMFPIMFELAVDAEPVTKQLFNSLCYQTTRWFAKNQARELDNALCLFDALTTGLSNTSKAGAVRDLCASLIGELLEWSLKYVPDESRHEGLVNHRYILRTLFGLMMHTEAGHRLGAVTAIRRCIAHLMKHRVLFDEYALEILKVSFRSISRSGEHFCTVGMSTRGADVAMAVVVREVLQAMKSQEITHAQLSGSAFSESTEPFLEDLLEYTLSEDSFLRREAQQTFCAVAPFMIQDVQQWFHLHSHVTSTCIDSLVPEIGALEHGGRALNKFIAAIQWSGWFMMMSFGKAAFFTTSRTTHFRTVAQYLDRISERFQASFDDTIYKLCEQDGLLIVEILRLLNFILKSSHENDEKESLLSLMMGDDGYKNVAGLISASIFTPQNLGEDTEASRKRIMRAAAQLTQTMVSQRNFPYISGLSDETLRALRDFIITPKFDLSAINLESPKGCIAAQHVSDVYRELANVFLLRRVLPKEGDSSAKVLALRASSAVCKLGRHTSPQQRTVCEAVVQLCLHLNISPPVLLDLLLDRKPGASGVKMGEPFYRNYKESIIRACKFQFEEYAPGLLKVSGKDIESSSGIVATDIVISVMELATPKKESTQSARLEASRVFSIMMEHISSLCPLHEGYEGATADVKNNRHQRFVTIVGKLVDLYQTLGDDQASYHFDDSIISGLMICTRSDCISLSSHIDAVILVAEVLQRVKISKESYKDLGTSLGVSLNNMVFQERCDSKKFEKRYPSTIKAFKKAFITCRLPSLMTALLPFYKDSDAKLIVQNSENDAETGWDQELVINVWKAVENTKMAFEVRVMAVHQILPSLLAQANASQIATFFEDNSVDIMKDITATGDLLLSTRSFSLLCELYTKCTKEELTAGPCVKVPKLNAMVSKAAMSELSGLGVSANAKCGQEEIVLRVHQLAFSVFSTLLVRTQTDVKFYNRLFHDLKAWNKLVDRTKRLELEARSILPMKKVSDNGPDTKAEQVKRSGFTLSSTLASKYSTLRTTHLYETDNAHIQIDGGPDELADEDKPHPSGQARDELEAHPVSVSVYKIMKLVVCEGLSGEADGSSPEMQIIEMFTMLLYSPSVLPAVKLLIIKALLRLNNELESEPDSIRDVGMTSVNASPSLLAAQPNLMIALLTSVIEISKNSTVDFVATPVREAVTVALDCDALWTSSFEEAKPCLLDSMEFVVRHGFSKVEAILKENLILLKKGFVRLRDAAQASAMPVSHCFQSLLACIHEHAACVPVDGDESKICAMRKLFALQLVGSLLHEEERVLRLNDDAVVMTDSNGRDLGEQINLPLIHSILNCLLRPNQRTSRSVNSVAAALLGKIMETDGVQSMPWHDALRRRLKELFESGSQDAFIDVLDKLTRRCPRFVHDGGFAPLVHSLLDKTHGESQLVALMILTREHDSEIVYSTYTRLLPFVPALVRSKDDEILEALFTALACGVAVRSNAAERKSNLKLWTSALNEADRTVGAESVVNVREAHTRMCIAVAEMYPELLNEVSLQGPLLQAVADSASANRRDEAMKFWNKRLRTDNFAVRFYDTLQIVPNSKLEGSWLAAACRLVFAVQEMSTTGQAPLIENDLSECVFTDAKLDTSRRHGGSQSMVPLFSSRATQRSDQQDDADVSTLVASVRSSLWDSDPLFASKLCGNPVKRLSKRTQSQLRNVDTFRGVMSPLTRKTEVSKRKISEFVLNEASHKLNLTRSYRGGDLADVKVSCNELITPFLLTAERDSALACVLLRDLVNCARQESEFIQARDQGDAWSPNHVMNSISHPMKHFIQNIQGNDASLVRFILSLCEIVPILDNVTATDIIRLAMSGKSLSSGVIALESLLTGSDGSSEKWQSLAQLFRSLGYDDAALLSFSNAFVKTQTMDAIQLEMSGKLHDSKERYKALFTERSDTLSHEYQFLKSEYFRCAERLGDWDDLEEELGNLKTGQFDIHAALDTVTHCIPGEASGGSDVCTAFRVALRQPLVDWSPFFNKVFAQEDHRCSFARAFGVELAMYALTNEKRSDVLSLTQQTYESFLDAWSTTRSSSKAVRRKLLQSLQPAVEIEETLLSIEEIRESLQYMTANLNLDKANSIVNALDSKWQKRWPSAVYDPSEVWERVITFRSRMLGTLVSVIPEIQTNSITSMRTEMWLVASNGLREVGQTHLSSKFFRKYLQNLQQTNTPESWRMYEALFELKLTTGTQSAVQKALEMCQCQLSMGKWKEEDEISCRILEARMCERLARAGGADSDDYAEAAIRGYTLAQDGARNMKQSIDASLRLAHFCDALLKSATNDRGSDYSEVFVRQTLIALKASGTKRSAPARHLLPRLLVLLREVITDDTAFEFGQALSRVPVWLFLDWIPQLISMMSDSQLDAVASPLIRSLVSKYPAAVRPHFNLMKFEMDTVVSQRMNFALASSLHDGFNRAMELLDFPLNRYNFWRRTIQLREYQQNFDAAANALEDMIYDLTNVASSGPINKRFAKIAAPILKSIVENKSQGISDKLKRAEAKIMSLWSEEFEDLDQSTRLRLNEFSSWFEDYENVKQLSSVLEMPGQYDNITGPPEVERHVTVMGFAPELQIFASKQRPKKITIRGSDGRDYQFIAKGGEDLRQDERVQRLFRAMNGLLAHFAESRGRGLELRTFHVSPLSNRNGLIEFIGNTSPLLRIINESLLQNEEVSTFAEHQRWIRERALTLGKRKSRDGTETTTTSHAHYLQALGKYTGIESNVILERLRMMNGSEDVLRQVLFRSAGSAEAFIMMRQAFAASLASSSICGYVAGVGDRHLDNILLDFSTGELIHIDFGYVFGTATLALPIPELVPFRATSALLDVLKPLNAQSWLEIDMARTMRALQDGSTLLKGVMDIFLRDPLIDWERDAFNSGRKASAAQHIQDRITRACGKLELENPGVMILEECAPKHKGSSYWKNLCALLRDSNTEQSRKCSDVDEQVRSLIDLATNPDILAVAWSGWRPWL